MTSIGRGRGWASAQTREPMLRRPGTIPTQNTDTFDCSDILDEINRVSDYANLNQQVQDAYAYLSSVEKDKLKTVVDRLHTYALNDRQFGYRYMKLFGSIFAKHSDLVDNENIPLRRIVINKLQNDYENRLKLKEENLVQFRNAVYLLYEASNIMFRANVFKKALIDYWQMLVAETTLEDIRMAAEQITNCGKEVFSPTSNSMPNSGVESVTLAARQTLVTGNLCPTSRALLLYILDIAHCDFSSLPTNLRDFYLKHIGDSSFLLKEDNEKSDNQASQFQEPSEDREPREIRKSPKKSHAKPPNFKRPSDNKYWNHDDRFDKDYK